jgi:hypothetical protein
LNVKSDKPQDQLATANDFTLTRWGNVRVADNPAAILLFQEYGSDRNKFLALLMRSYITCWARRTVAGAGDLVEVPGSIWNSGARFIFLPKGRT